MSHFDQNNAHFEIFGAVTRDHTLLVIPHDLQLNATSRSNRRILIINALGQFIDLKGVAKIYDDDKRKMETEIERRLLEHVQVIVYELVKSLSVSGNKIDEVTVYEFGKPFSDIGTIMNIEYNLSSQGFRMKLENIELEGVQDTRVKRYRIEV